MPCWIPYALMSSKVQTPFGTKSSGSKRPSSYDESSLIDELAQRNKMNPCCRNTERENEPRAICITLYSQDQLRVSLSPLHSSCLYTLHRPLFPSSPSMPTRGRKDSSSTSIPVPKSQAHRYDAHLDCPEESDYDTSVNHEYEACKRLMKKWEESGEHTDTPSIVSIRPMPSQSPAPFSNSISVSAQLAGLPSRAVDALQCQYL